jgi:hypothetical protein
MSIITGEPQFDRGCFVHERERCAVQERSERQGSTTTCNHSPFTGQIQAEMGTRGKCFPLFSPRRQEQNGVYAEMIFKVYAHREAPFYDDHL